MRSLLQFAFMILCCCTLLSCSNKEKEWVTYTSGDGGFSVLMPANPVKREKTEVTPFGKQVVHFISWKPSSFSINKLKLFEISYTDCPSRYITDSIMQSVMLDSSINMRKKDFTEKDFPSENIEFNSYPGRAFILDVKDDITIVKEFFANNRRYDLVVVVKKTQGSNAEAASFFNSFQVIR
jgi:hypothetical protein